MRLVLFRHGIAETAHDSLPDAKRALTARGIERTVTTARGLARLINPPQTILTSPKTRAMQTAAIVGNELNLVPRRANALATESPESILRMLRARKEDYVLLVGHEPSLSRLIEHLCGGRVELKKAGAAMIQVSLRRSDVDGPAQLKWLLTPQALRMIAKR